ncbi:MAG: hypothetical protein AAFZ15_24425 [Bacteroidota bacterium]
MKNIILSLLLLATSTHALGQVGINGAYYTFTANEWTDLLNELTGQNFDNATGYQVGVDYWLRLETKRIEFFPEISYAALNSNSGNSEIDITLLGFHLNTNIYPFDFDGDCDCPTWSKSGSIFEKGFFFQISPGYNRGEIKVADENVQGDETFNYFHLGIGAGLDIGISDLITVTPLVKYYYSTSVEYGPTSLSTIDYSPAESNIRQFYAGVRLGLRFNE